MGDFIPINLKERKLSVSGELKRKFMRERNRGRTSLRHFWLRIAYKSRVVAVSLAIVLVLRRLASLNDLEVQKYSFRVEVAQHTGRPGR